jgi:hypothetical protein
VVLFNQFVFSGFNDYVSGHYDMSVIKGAESCNTELCVVNEKMGFTQNIVIGYKGMPVKFSS